MISEWVALSLLAFASSSVNADGHGHRCRQLIMNDTLRDYEFRDTYEDEDSFCLEVTPPNISVGFLFHTFDGISTSGDNQGIITYDTATGRETDDVSSGCLIAQFDNACKFEPKITHKKCPHDVSVKRGMLSKIYVTRATTREPGNLRNVSVAIRAVNQYLGYFTNCSAATSAPTSVMILTRETPSQTSSPQADIGDATVTYPAGTSSNTTPTKAKFDSTTSYSDKTTSTGTATGLSAGAVIGIVAAVIMVFIHD